MQPLIIAATPNISWLHPEVDYPRTPQAIAEEAALCQQNGATMLHIHAEGRWKETIDAVHARCDVIIQCGMSSLPIPERMEVFKNKADMISVILNHHDEAFAQTECNVLHLREELAAYCRLCREYGVIPEWEVWHTGSVWNLNHLIDKKLVRRPFVTTLFFGWPGGTWSPPTVEEYLYRRRLMPEGCICNVSVMTSDRTTKLVAIEAAIIGEEQRDILAAAILNGDHVRVGTEDHPYDHHGKVVTTHALVRETAEMARALGRPLATVKQARKTIGL
jgi:3-keto-5-aminohexanoate cleavage enzyme